MTTNLIWQSTIHHFHQLIDETLSKSTFNIDLKHKISRIDIFCSTQMLLRMYSSQTRWLYWPFQKLSSVCCFRAWATACKWQLEERSRTSSRERRFDQQWVSLNLQDPLLTTQEISYQILPQPLEFKQIAEPLIDKCVPMHLNKSCNVDQQLKNWWTKVSLNQERNQHEEVCSEIHREKVQKQTQMQQDKSIQTSRRIICQKVTHCSS